MFEKYTEKARRVIFYARSDAGEFGSHSIETEHILLGLLREDKALGLRFLPESSAVEQIREEIAARTLKGNKIPTSVDMPVSEESKRVFAYATEEAESLAQQQVKTEHLLLGLLREENCFAAALLHQHGLQLDAVRRELRHNDLNQ